MATEDRGGGCGWKRGGNREGRSKGRRGGGRWTQDRGREKQKSNKQNHPEAGQRGDMEKRTGEGKGEATVQRNAAQAAVRSGFRVAGRGGAAHPPHPSTHHG